MHSIVVAYETSEGRTEKVASSVAEACRERSHEATTVDVPGVGS